MDVEVEPCDDFYDFACGGFLKVTNIPDDKSSVNTFTEISDQLQNQLRTSIEEKSPANEPKPFRLAKNLYQACMNKSEYLKLRTCLELLIFAASAETTDYINSAFDRSLFRSIAVILLCELNSWRWMNNC